MLDTGFPSDNRFPMKCAIMQPTYNPWLGYCDLIDKVDIFVFLDNVQLVKRSWQVRNRIKTPTGELFLTIPIKKTKSRQELLIKDALINDDHPWRVKHLKSLEFYYKKASYFDAVFPFIKRLILNPIPNLADFNINIIQKVAEKIGIKTPFVRASQIPNLKGKKDKLLANICKTLNCNTYISPQGSAVYLEKNSPGGEIVKNGIELYYHNYEHPTYNQLYGEFLPFMGIFDLLLNEGFKNALSIIRKGRREDIHYLEFRKRYLNLER